MLKEAADKIADDKAWMKEAKWQREKKERQVQERGTAKTKGAEEMG